MKDWKLPDYEQSGSRQQCTKGQDEQLKTQKPHQGVHQVSNWITVHWTCWQKWCHESNVPHQICKLAVQLFGLVSRNKKPFCCTNQKVSIAPYIKNCKVLKAGTEYLVLFTSDLNNDFDHFWLYSISANVLAQLPRVIKTLNTFEKFLFYAESGFIE